MNQCIECGRDLKLSNELIRCVDCMAKDEPIFITVGGVYEEEDEEN